ncbi:MAG TPA: hypothetical protein VFK78_00445 [Gemmatimonadales bacterium]|nr:hypothetical protein [Gemmatimonadales bacterium]
MKLKHAIHRLDELFRDRDSRAGILARELAREPKPGDAKLAELLCNERRSETRMDGSVNGSVVRTAWAAWEMMDLGLDALNGGLDRLLSWLLPRIEAGEVHEEPMPLALPNGVVMRGAGDAALAVRCLGLKTLLRARRDGRPGVAEQLAGVARLEPASPNLAACVLGVVAVAPAPVHDRAEAFVEEARRAQGSDGSWAGADLFNMLEALLLAGIEPARALIAKAAPALLDLQHDDGSFDSPPHEERALIGLRALHVALEA